MKYCIVKNILEDNDTKIKEIQKHGKIIYEVIRIIKGYPLFFKEHMERLKNTCDLMGVYCPCSYEIIFNNIRELCVANNILEGNIKVIINSVSNEYAVYFIPHSYPSKEQYDLGVKTILYHGERNNPNAKVQDNEFRNKVTEDIEKNNAYEAILIDNNGYITEGSKSNIFMVKGNTILTAPVKGVLPGITRSKIIEVIKSLNIEIKEESIHESKIDNLDALFISGTSPKILPISYINQLSFQFNNPLVRILTKEFDAFIEEDIKKVKNKEIKK